MPYNPDDPVLGTDMTQGEWDQLRSLLRKAEDGGKMNKLMTVHRKEVKNAPMNRNYPPADENTQQPVHPGTSPKVLGPASTTANSSTSVHGSSKSSSTATATEFKGPWKVPPIAPPDALKKAIHAGVVHGSYNSWKGWQNRPFDPSDDPWVTDDQNVEEFKGQEGNKKPVLQLYGMLCKAMRMQPLPKLLLRQLMQWLGVLRLTTLEQQDLQSMFHLRLLHLRHRRRRQLQFLQLLLEVSNSCRNKRQG